MIFRQVAGVSLFNSLVGWKKAGRWFAKHSIKALPVAAGAIGMGCIGYPNHPVFEITNRCNLNCIHCHTNGGNDEDGELSTEEVKKVIDDLSNISIFRMLVFTGGEPLVRKDIFEILEYSKKRGFVNTIATNGTLITESIARELKGAGVAGVAVSLDSAVPEIHNKIRQNNKAYELALRGINAVKKAGILLQINTTAMEYNFDNLGDLIKLADSFDAGIMLMYQLVPVGRGCAIKDASLDLNTNEKLVRHISEQQKEVATLVESVAAPQYWVYLLEKNCKNRGFTLKLSKKVFHGCTAGRGMVYIKPNGAVWSCPFVEIEAGNVRNTPVDVIWRESELFKNLRNRENLLKGKCGNCEYNMICGGCRGRAYALTGDYLEEDRFCFIKK